MSSNEVRTFQNISAGTLQLYDPRADYAHPRSSKHFDFIDAWSDCTMEKYLTITGHWMTKEWQIMTPFLATIPWDGVMSGDSISETILDKVLTDTDCFIFAVTSDGGSNMIAAGQDLVGSDTVRCFLHILHLLFGSFMDDPSYSEKISSLREYIKTIRRCQNKRLVLKKSAKQAKLKRSSLILDNVTRWNSTYLMIVRYIEFLLLLRDLHHNDEAFRDLSFPLGTSSFYQAIVKLWEPFYNITIEAQSRALSTLPMIPGWIDNLYSHLDKILQTPTHSEIRDSVSVLARSCLALGGVRQARYQRIEFRDGDGNFKPSSMIESMKDGVSVKWSSCAAKSFGAGDP